MTRAVPSGSLLRRRIVVGGVVLILAFAASSAFDVWRSYGQSLAAVNRELGNLARALAAEAARRFQATDAVLRDTETWFEANAGRASLKQAAETLEQRGSGLPLGAIYITDGAGALVYSSDALPPELVSAEPGSLVFLNGQAMLVLSRELNAGRANALLELSAIQEVYDAIELSPGNTVTLYRNDGMLLARRPYTADRVGWKFPQWDEALQSIARQEVKSPHRPPATASPIDGRIVFRGFAHVQDSPFSVMTSRDATSALASWRELAVHSAVRTVVLSLLGALLIAALVRQVARADAGEQALREQAALLDLTHDTVFVRDMNDVITYWNRGAEERYGWNRQEAVGQVAHKLLRTIFPEALEVINAELQRTGRWEGELIHARRDGTQVMVASRWALQRDEPRRPVAVLETNNDITERKRWRSLTEALPQLVWAAAPDGACDYFSTQWTEYTGVAEADLLGWRWMEVLHPDDRENTRKVWTDSVAGHRRYDVEYRVRRHDGAYGWFKTRGAPIRDREGRITKWFGTCTDITDQKRAEQALHDSEQALRRARDQLEVKVAERTAELQRSETRYRNIFQTVGVSIWEEDFSRLKAAIDALKARGVQDFRRYLADSPQFADEAIAMVRVVDVNDVGLKLFAAASKEELLASLHRIFVPETRAAFVEGLVAVAEGRTFFETETVLQTLNGATLSVLFAITFPAPDARFDSVLVTITDITERRAREREREEMERQLQQAAKMEAIGRLAGGIAHDFNNILGAILGYGELAQSKAGESGPLREQLDQVMQAGNRGKRLVEHILAFSRSGVGERLPVHVQSVAEETLDLLAASLPPTIRLEKMLRGADAAVVGDATQLHQVTMNLCTNAVQAMPNGGVLSVTLERTDIDEARELAHGALAPGPYVRLQVSDTGTGIPRAVLERIFDPFFTTKRVGDGTGLGLSLVHGIVADFGGAVDVETREGAGTTFTVWLPASGEAPARVVDAAGVLPHGNGEAVMIVDDERPLVNVAEEVLAGLGYEPVGFSSSVDALAAFRAEPERYDIVLTDETMPDMTGTDLAHEIRRLRADIPIVLMSGYSGPQLTERARSAGVWDILRKPLVSRDIAEALARVIPARA
jgi:PAS domain S-box-containing protein